MARVIANENYAGWPSSEFEDDSAEENTYEKNNVKSNTQTKPKTIETNTNVNQVFDKQNNKFLHLENGYSSLLSKYTNLTNDVGTLKSIIDEQYKNINDEKALVRNLTDRYNHLLSLINDSIIPQIKILNDNISKTTTTINHQDNEIKRVYKKMDELYMKLQKLGIMNNRALETISLVNSQTKKGFDHITNSLSQTNSALKSFMANIKDLDDVIGGFKGIENERYNITNSRINVLEQSVKDLETKARIEYEPEHQFLAN